MMGKKIVEWYIPEANNLTELSKLTEVSVMLI